MIALIVCLLLVVLILIGVPVAVAMGLTSAGVFASMGFTDILAVMGQRICLWSFPPSPASPSASCLRLGLSPVL